MSHTFLSAANYCLAQAENASFDGQVVAVSDGDTISVLHNGINERVRLNAIDCPEKIQAYGIEAKKMTCDLCLKKQVTVCTHGKDRFGRTIGDVRLPDGNEVNSELVRSGLAWWYRKYDPVDTKLEQLEAEARASKRGLWKDDSPLAPWDFRHGVRSTALGAPTNKSDEPK
jgi:endonuclease YncB( thermonuclease family)